MFYDGVIDITTNDEEYCWNEIFPDVHLVSTDAKREQINFNKYKPFANLQCTSEALKMQVKFDVTDICTVMI